MQDRGASAYAQAVTLDQLQVFIAIVEAGSFSAAARRLRRTQGGVSYHVAALEEQLGVALFDRSGRLPKLTADGAQVLAHARRVLGGVHGLRATGFALSSGLEPRVSVSVNILLSPVRLAEVLAALQNQHPSVDVQVNTCMLRGVSRRLREGKADLGVISHIGRSPDLEVEPCGSVELVAVVAPSHPLGRPRRRLYDDSELQEHVHLLLSDGEDLRPESEEVGGFPSTRRWRVDDLSTRLALLRGGLGWARMPRHLVADDLSEGTLVPLRAKRWRGQKAVVDLFVARLRGHALGPAGQRLWRLLARS